MFKFSKQLGIFSIKNVCLETAEGNVVHFPQQKLDVS